MNDFSPTLKIVTVWGLLGVALFLAVQFWQAQEARTRFTATADGVIEMSTLRALFPWFTALV